MSSDNSVVNLNRFKKDRERTARKTQADIKALKHGRTKAERFAEAARDARTRARLDQLKFDDE